jgi:hypothetical protein
MIPTNKSELKHFRIEGTIRARKNRQKVAGKRHENPMSYKGEIDATMKASIHSEARFFTSRGKI